MRRLRTFGDIPIEWSTKSIFPPRISIERLNTFSKSSTFVASAAITSQFSFSANELTVPILTAIGVLESVIDAPSSTARSATFHAIDCSLSAPKIMPLLPFNKL